MCEFEGLKGKTITSIEKGTDTDGGDAIFIAMENGDKYILHHPQDCCESVTLVDVYGDLTDLVGTTIIAAEEKTVSADTSWGSETSTFYHLGTINGFVDMIWRGESNGYYSEAVELFLIRASNDGE